VAGLEKTMTDNFNPPAAAGPCTTGIDGLDNILFGGGLPRNCLYLVQGDPGSGKTTLALQFLLEGLRRGERVFYITLSETKAELEKSRVHTIGRSSGYHVFESCRATSPI
jgi:circadian clock protein KaiC